MTTRLASFAFMFIMKYRNTSRNSCFKTSYFRIPNQYFAVRHCHLLAKAPKPSGASLASPNILVHPIAHATTLSSGDIVPVITVSEIKRYLDEHDIKFEQGYSCLKCFCPFCQAAHRHPQIVHKNKCGFINVITGQYLCYNCKIVVPWQTFQDYASIAKSSKITELQESRQKLESTDKFFVSLEEASEIQRKYSSTVPLYSIDKNELFQITKKFKLMGILQPTLKTFDIRLCKETSSLVFPIHGPNRELVALKYITINDDKVEESIYPRSSIIGLFGWQRVSKLHLDLIITRSELDVLSVVQETNSPAVCLIQGTSCLPLEILPLFEQFRKLTIWFSNHLQEWEAAKMFARKLGEKRCNYIRPKDDQPEPYEALQRKLHLINILKTSQSIAHKAITTFHSLRQDVLSELSHGEQVSGVKWQRFPALNRLLKGHRCGELTVFTGPTGSGKTTFMCEYSLDLCSQGVNTLWGSFEIKNVRLAKIMLTQFSQLSLDKNLEEFHYWADKFERLPLYFMTFHGEQSIRNVLDAMSHAVYVHDIQHVVVDNVQFMMGVSEDIARMDRFWKQDLLVAAFRKFATQHNCHVTLVMHPRKERDTEELSNSSIFGGAKASQEADNILILQDKRLSSIRGRKYIQVTKNRFDGELGIVPMEFDKETLIFSLKKKKKPSLAGDKKTSTTVEAPIPPT